MNKSNSTPNISLFTHLRRELGDMLPVVRLTKATLVHLSHTLEDLVLSHKLPALLFTGFQESSHWKEETQHYQQLMQIAQQVCIFAGKPLPPESDVAQIHVELADNDPLRQEWFLMILSSAFAVVLCGQDNTPGVKNERLREFETLWSFDPAVVERAFHAVENVIAAYRPEKLAAIQASYQRFPPPLPDPSLLTKFTMEMMSYQERLNGQLRESEQRFVDMSEAISHAIYIGELDAQDNYRNIYIAPNLVKITGYPVERFLQEGHFWRSLIHPDDQYLLPLDRQQLRHSAFSIVEYRMRHADGHYVWVQNTGTLKGQPNSGYVTVYGVIEDITRRKQTELALAASEQRFRDMTQTISHTVFIGEINAQGVYQCTYVSPNITKLTGVDASLFLDDGSCWVSLICPEDTALYHAASRRAAETHFNLSDYRIRRANGTYGWVQITCTIKDQTDSDTLLVYGVIEDIDQRKHAELALSKSEERFQEIMAMISHTIYVGEWSHDGAYQNYYISPGNERITGYPSQMLLDDGHFWRSLIHPEDMAEDSHFTEDALHLGYGRGEYRVRRKDGQYVWVQNSGIAKYQPETDSHVFYGVIEDISARKQIELALAASEERFREMIIAIPQTVFVAEFWDDGRVVNQYISPRIEALTGYAAQKFMDDSTLWGTLIHPSDVLRHHALRSEVMEQGHSMQEYRIRRADETIIWVQNTSVANRQTNADYAVVYGVVEDITQRKRVEIELAESGARIRDLIASVDTCIYVGQIEQRGQAYAYQSDYVSPTIERLTGYSADKFLAETQFWPTLIHPDDLDVAAFSLKEFIFAESHDAEYRIRKADGSYIYVQNRRTLKHVPHRKRWMVYGVLEDVTMRREAERAKLENALLKLQVEKERELNQLKTHFMTTVSHEFRTPLATILSSSELLERYYDRMKPENRTQRFQVIRDRVEHMREMLDDINIVMAGQSDLLRLNLADVNIKGVFNRSITATRETYGEDRRIHFVYDGAEFGHVDANLLRRIISNLLANALKYSPPETQVDCLANHDGQHLEFHIRDMGIGIPFEDRPYLFQPFYRGSNIGAVGGTGLGLRIVLDCVNLHNGTVTYHSEPGQGSVFTVILPSSAIPPAAPSAS